MEKLKFDFVKHSIMRRLKSSIGVVEVVILDFYNFKGHKENKKSDDLYLSLHPLMVKLEDLKRLQQGIIQEMEEIQKKMSEK